MLSGFLTPGARKNICRECTTAGIVCYHIMQNYNTAYQTRPIQQYQTQGRRESAIKAYINSPEFDWFRFSEWGFVAQRDICLAHKNNQTRYDLFVFLVANGYPPDDAGQLITITDYRGGEPLYGHYDRVAWRQLAYQMPRQYRNGNLTTAQGKNIWDILSRRTRLFVG